MSTRPFHIVISFVLLILSGNLYSQNDIQNPETSRKSSEKNKDIPKTDNIDLPQSVETKKENSEINNISNEEDFFKMEESISAPSRTREVTASRIKERIMEAPASMMIITEDDIKKRGYTSIDEIFYDLPGFDVSFANGAQYTTIYQRGYRTPFTQRILFMINGIVDNHLYMQSADFSRQYPLTNIKRVEVVYGPASAVYGPNAFQGVVNIITKDGKDQNKPVDGKVSLQVGQNNTYSIDGSANVRNGDFYASASGRGFRSDEPDMSKRSGFNNSYWTGNTDVWGPILFQKGSDGKSLGTYRDPSRDYGGLASVGYKGWKVGTIFWDRYEGYGVQYPGEHTQTNTFWKINSKQLYVEQTEQWSEKFKTYSLLLYRESDTWGHWAEAYPDSPPKDKNSFISYTSWNSLNSSVLTYQNFEYKATSYLQILGGLKYEGKRLTKNYDIPGYYNAFSTYPELNNSKYFPNGFGVGYSTDLYYLRPPDPKKQMPESNRINTVDTGSFLVSIIDIGKFRFSPGVRYDKNSLYGQSINPRITAIYHFSNKTTFKLLYGEAFNEPAPILLFGGWNGRASNPNMKPEKERSHEVIAMHQAGRFFHETSLYYSRYENVIKEEAENAGKRKIYGMEYKIRAKFKNFIPESTPIEAYLFYTYTESQSSIYYDHSAGKWKEGDTALGRYESLNTTLSAQIPRTESYKTLGDIARHKVQLGFNLPIGERYNWNLRGIYTGPKTLYMRNALRDEGKTISPQFVLNTAFIVDFKLYGFLTLKILNLLNHSYNHPGIEGADGGDNYYKRALGFRNSLLPQPGRYIQISWTLEF